MDKSGFSYSLSLRIFKDEKFFGLGVAQLLENVQKTNSLLRASKNMSMAYTKALTMINRAEKALGYSLLIRKTGGAEGGGSHLTDNAEKLLKLYRQFESNVLSYTDKEFDVFLNKMGELE